MASQIASSPSSSSVWTPERFFDALPSLGRLRVISVCGPSVFEAICEAAPYEARDGFLNMITDAYHWHFSTARFRHLRSVDSIHARSARRVLFFELREQEDAPPFLRIYVFRPHGEEFDADAVERFETMHRELMGGVPVRTGVSS
jgi:putative heme iron utilization protein